MKEFWLLFNLEFKHQFCDKYRNKKIDISSLLLTSFVTILVALTIIYLFANILRSYFSIGGEESERAKELLNIFYLMIVIIESFACVEKMRKVLVNDKNRELYLKWPIDKRKIVLSKVLVLLLWNMALTFIFAMPVIILFYYQLHISFSYFIYGVIVCLFLPFVELFFAGVLIIPYLKVVRFLENKFILIFVIYTIILIGCFILYSIFLKLLQEKLSFGMIYYLDNERILSVLQKIKAFSILTSSLANITLGDNLFESLLLIVSLALASVVIMVFVSQFLFNNFDKKQVFVKRSKQTLQRIPFIALLQKEFICIFRDSKQMFSCFSVALAMPVMVYCIHSLLDSFINYTIGINLSFSLVLLIVLSFSVLTNTFCATNISRDNTFNFKIKTLPIKVSKVMASKVTFCFIVSFLSLLITITVLIFNAFLSFIEGLYLLIIALMFSLSQILIATRLDLNYAKIFGKIESEYFTNKTIVKVVSLGLIVSIFVGLLTLVFDVLSRSLEFFKRINIYIFPMAIIVYFGFSVLYFCYKCEEKFELLT